MLERAFMEDAYSRRNRREARTMEEYNKNLIHAEAKEEKRYRKHVMKENYSKFLIDTKDLLLTESIFYFVNESLPTNCSLDDRKKAESIVYSFVKEEGANKLLMKYETSTELLANIANIVNETYNRIVNETECNSDKCTNFFVKKSSTDDFYTKIGREFKFRIPFFECVKNTLKVLEEANETMDVDKMINECINDKFTGKHKYLCRCKLYSKRKF